MQAKLPKGVTIYRRNDRRGTLVCTIKSRGRTGSWVRSRLMRLSPEAREPILWAWSRGGYAEIPA